MSGSRRKKRRPSGRPRRRSNLSYPLRRLWRIRARPPRSVPPPAHPALIAELLRLGRTWGKQNGDAAEEARAEYERAMSRPAHVNIYAGRRFGRPTQPLGNGGFRVNPTRAY
jgi:hypothetical protein